MNGAIDARERRVGFALLAIASLGWGLNWPAMRVLVRDVPALFARGSSGLAAALLLAVLVMARGQSMAFPRKATGRLCVAAFCNVFAWVGFTTLSVKWLPVNHAVLLVYTMPLWTVLLAWPILGQRPSAWSIAGLLLGGMGLWTLFSGGAAPQLSPGEGLGAVFALAAAFFFALGAVTVRPIETIGPVALLAWQLALGSLPMLLIGAAVEPLDATGITVKSLLIWSYMTFMPMGVCYLAWFSALRRLRPATASMITLLTPVVGVLSANVFLSELFTARVGTALLLTIGGIALSLASKSR